MHTLAGKMKKQHFDTVINVVIIITVDDVISLFVSTQQNAVKIISK